LNQEMITW